MDAQISPSGGTLQPGDRLAWLLDVYCRLIRRCLLLCFPDWPRYQSELGTPEILDLEDLWQLGLTEEVLRQMESGVRHEQYAFDAFEVEAQQPSDQGGTQMISDLPEGVGIVSARVDDNSILSLLDRVWEAIREERAQLHEQYATWQLDLRPFHGVRDLRSWHHFAGTVVQDRGGYDADPLLQELEGWQNEQLLSIESAALAAISTGGVGSVQTAGVYDNAFMGLPDLMRVFSVSNASHNALKVALGRWRLVAAVGYDYIVNEARRRNTSLFYYRIGAVHSVVSQYTDPQA